MNSELLSPAGDFTTALSAFAAGADAVYCGLSEFSARAFAPNLSHEELANLIAYARAHGKKVYVTFNTLIDEDQLEGAVEALAKLEELGPDGVIVQDLGVAQLVRRHFPKLELHASTQLVAHNLEGVLALKELGFRRVVLARELSLAEITTIAQRCGARKVADDGRPELELEVFIHGALCYSISGLCLYGALEKGRSGNRGTCPYCCRQRLEGKGKREEGRRKREGEDGQRADGFCYPFSMKDLRLGEDARKLVEAGVSSLKIEGRMKSPLYVASVTRYYRDILDGTPARVTPGDLETVFSRRTTELYFNGRGKGDSPIDADSLGHLGTPVGTVKRVTRDRDGLAWLRFHTARALEKHDGLQFEAVDANGKHLGLGIVEMRQAISRRPVFEVNAGVDVEILLPEGGASANLRESSQPNLAAALKPGMKIYCSMSNAVKRLFPAPSFRPSDYAGVCALDVTVRLAKDGLTATVDAPDGQGAAAARDAGRCAASRTLPLEPAKAPDRTAGAVEKAFAKLGGTGYRLGRLTVEDPEKLFAPPHALNDLRRDLVERLDAWRDRARRAKIDAALADDAAPPAGLEPPRAVRRLKVRPGQKVPPGDWDEIVVAITAETADDVPARESADDAEGRPPVRLALPVYTAEPDFSRLRTAVKRLLRAGYAKWECADLATLRLLRALGVTDITADGTLAAFNSRALSALAAAGVTRFVASPENSRENLQYLAESGYAVEFLAQQSTPLFLSLTAPAPYASEAICTFRKDGLWVTTRRAPRTFAVPAGAATRLDLSWDPENAD